MINYPSEMVSALKSILPTHYEMALNSKTTTPCISFMETNNYVSSSGDTLGYSKLTYQIKVWGHNIVELQKYAQQIDEALRPLGFKRISARELYDMNSTMIQKIMMFEALAFENY